MHLMDCDLLTQADLQKGQRFFLTIISIDTDQCLCRNILCHPMHAFITTLAWEASGLVRSSTDKTLPEGGQILSLHFNAILIAAPLYCDSPPFNSGYTNYKKAFQTN